MRLFPDLLGCQAAFVEPPQPGRDLSLVRITLPDGWAAFMLQANGDEIRSG